MIKFEDLEGFWVAFLIAALMSKPIMILLNKLKSRQTVSAHAPEGHQIKQGTPTMGGIIILAGFFGALLFNPRLKENIPVAILIAVFALIGFIDDYVVPRLMPGKRGLGWKQKIFMQVFAAAVPMYMLDPANSLQIAGGIFFILFFANAFNFSDGLDGLAGTILIGMIVGIVGMGQIIGLKSNSEMLVPMLWMGALLPFLYWNAPKAKVFMGDVGSLAIGAYLGLYVTQLVFSGGYRGVEGNNNFIYFAIFVWSLMMIAELVPVPLQIASVKIRKKKLFPYTPIHHAFEKAGWPETRVVFVFAICQLLCSMAAIMVIYIGTIK
jgi:phospho-N-acetylmuramoyl-pentapeptide-transferase